MSLEDILDTNTDLKLGKSDIIAAIKLPVPQPTDSFWSHKVCVLHLPDCEHIHHACQLQPSSAA